jgi:transposase
MSRRRPAACCGDQVLRRIGVEVTEVLEYVPSSFTVIQHVRPKMTAAGPAKHRTRCRRCRLSAAGQVQAVGLPLHRRCVIYARQAFDLDRSTGIGSVAALVRPLVAAIRQRVCAARCCMPTTPRCLFSKHHLVRRARYRR